VWCKESALAGWWLARWLAVPAEDLGSVRVDGRTLAELVEMVRQANLDAPTELARRPRQGPAPP
jgi:hypothetical protein